MAILFHQQTTITLKNKRKLKEYIESLFYAEKKKLDSLSIVFCSDEYLLAINQQFLHHDYYTDVITFDLTESHKKAISGELYISVERVKENAIIAKSTFTNELHRVIFHGALHLCGYNDKTTKQQQTIRLKEDLYLSQYFV